MLHAGEPARFAEHTIATGLKGGYQVVVADMNHDGKPDLIALASGMPELVWYENPTWERHVIAGGFTRMINCAAWDADGDGIPEIVLASGFSNEAKNSAGIVSRAALTTAIRAGRGKSRRSTGLPTSHRLRWADIDGSGKKVVVNAPLTGAHAEAPDYRDHTPLVFYRPGEWKREIIGAQNSGVVHGIYHRRLGWRWARRNPDRELRGHRSLQAGKRRRDGAGPRSPRAIRRPWPKSRIERRGGGPARQASAIWRPSSRGTATRWWCTGSSGEAWQRQRDRRLAGGWAHHPDRRSGWRRQRRDHRRFSRRRPQRVSLLRR